MTLASARRATAHVQVISQRFSESSDPVWYYLDQETLNTLISLLSYSLQAAISNSADTEQTSDPHDEDIRNNIASPKSCKLDSSSGVYMKRSISAKRAVQLVVDILQTASDLMLVRGNKRVLVHIYLWTYMFLPFISLLPLFFQRYILFHEAREHRVSTGLITLYAAHQNQTSTVISSGSSTVHMPASLIQLLFVHLRRDTESRPHRPCVLSMLTELTHSPCYPGRVSLA